MTRTLYRCAVAGLAVVGLAAAVASSVGLYGLGRETGWSRPLALTLPVTIDALAGTATVVWLSEAAPAAARRYARVLTFCAIAASLAGNAGWHALMSGAVGWRLLMVLTPGAVPTLGLAAVVHLLALLGTGSPAEPATEPAAEPLSEPVGEPPAEPVPAVTAGAAEPRAEPVRRLRSVAAEGGSSRRPVSAPVRPVPDAVAAMAAHWLAEAAAGREPSGAELAEVGGVSRATGKRRAAEWRVSPPAADELAAAGS